MTEPSDQAELILLHPGPHRRILLATKTTIGSGDQCDIRLLEISVAPLHATVTRVGIDWIVRATTAAEVRINDVPIQQAVLRDRDVLQFGEVIAGFRRLYGAVAAALPPVPASLELLREDVVAQRACLAEEKAAWETELERRREELVAREEAFRQRASRCARALERDRERMRRRRVHNERRSSELDRLAKKLVEQKKKLSFEKLEHKVRERHLDDYFARIEEKRVLFERESTAAERSLADRRAELNALTMEIERKRGELESLQNLPADAPAGVALAYRELMLTAREKELETAEEEIESVTKHLDQLLAQLERQAVVAQQFSRTEKLRPIEPLSATDDAGALVPVRLHQEADSISDIEDDVQVLPMIPFNQRAPKLVAESNPSADLTRYARNEEYQVKMRSLRIEHSELIAESQVERQYISAARHALHAEEVRFAQEVAREREAIGREREALERRRGWIDRGQQRFAKLQAKALQLRLAPFSARPDASATLAHMGEIIELWQQFRCDVLRERLELTCERERLSIKDRELVRLRRLVHKQRSLLATIVADRRLEQQLRTAERDQERHNANERESAVERLAFALIDSRPPEPTDAPKAAKRAA